jgi:hypothetical protein
MRRRRVRRPRPFARRSRRTRKSVLLVFALLFAPAVARRASGACVDFASVATVSTAGDFARSVVLADLDADGDLDLVAASEYDDEIAWYRNSAGDGSLWSRITISTTTDGASSVVAADLDNDGDFDVASASRGDDRVDLYYNLDGDGSSWLKRGLNSTGLDLRGVAAGDLDGDGDVDLASASYAEDEIFWYENVLADSAFTAHTVASSADGATSVAAADLDRDGDVDLVSSSQLDDEIAWYVNDGTPSVGAWSAVVISTGSDVAFAVATADVDGDGDLDLFAASAGDGKFAWYEQGPNPLASPWTVHTVELVIGSAISVDAADLDGDGDVDLVGGMGMYTGFLRWHENLDGSGTLWTLHSVATTSGGLPFAVRAGDLDGDGDPDLVSCEPLGDVLAWYRNDSPNGAALFPATTAVHTAADGASSIAAVDLDRDGDPDLLAASPGDDTVAWHEGNGSGTLWTEHALALGTDAAGAVHAVAADLDRDGDLDAFGLLRESGRVVWYENDGTPAAGGFGVHSIATLSTAGGLDVYFLAAADLDGDGDADLLAQNYASGLVVWYENDGTPANDTAWAAHSIATAAPGPRAVGAADLDRDGDLDAFAGTFSGIAWYANDGTPATGLWSAFTVTALPTTTFSLFVADVDRDGDPDLVATHFDAGVQLAWYENDGTPATGTWGTHSVVTADPQQLFHFAAAADFDRDGDLDLASVNLFDDVVSWHENANGTGTSWTTRTLASGVDGAISLATADVDGDGDADLFSAGSGDDTLRWHENRSSLVFAHGLDSEPDAAPNLACWSASVP